MLINMTSWSEEHYKYNTERYIGRLCKLLAMQDIAISLDSLTEYLPTIFAAQAKAARSEEGKKTCAKSRKTLNSLRKQGAALANIEISGENIGSFRRIARKYNLDFALKRDDSKDPPNWIVFFKSKDDRALQSAFNEYSKGVLGQKNRKQSMLARLAKIKERLRTMSAPVRSKKRGDREL